MSAFTTDFFTDLDRLRLPAPAPQALALKPDGPTPRPTVKNITGELVRVRSRWRGSRRSPPGDPLSMPCGVDTT